MPPGHDQTVYPLEQDTLEHLGEPKYSSRYYSMDNRPSGGCLRAEGICGHPEDKFINTDMSPLPKTGLAENSQGWAVDNKLGTGVAGSDDQRTPPLLLCSGCTVLKWSGWSR